MDVIVQLNQGGAVGDALAIAIVQYVFSHPSAELFWVLNAGWLHAVQTASGGHAIAARRVRPANIKHLIIGIRGFVVSVWPPAAETTALLDLQNSMPTPHVAGRRGKLFTPAGSGVAADRPH